VLLHFSCVSGSAEGRQQAGPFLHCCLATFGLSSSAASAVALVAAGACLATVALHMLGSRIAVCCFVAEWVLLVSDVSVLWDLLAAACH